MFRPASTSVFVPSAGASVMDAEEFRRAGYKAIDQSFFLSILCLISVIDYLSNIRERPVLPSVQPGFMQKALPTGIPKKGVKWEEIQPDIEKIIMVDVKETLALILAWNYSLATSPLFFLVSL